MAVGLQPPQAGYGVGYEKATIGVKSHADRLAEWPTVRGRVGLKSQGGGSVRSDAPDLHGL